MQEKKITECIAKEELQKLIKQSHIPGAINITLTDLENRSGELSKEAIIISACGKGAGRSEEAAGLLKQMGFAKARFLCGGTIGWFQIAI